MLAVTVWGPDCYNLVYANRPRPICVRLPILPCASCVTVSMKPSTSVFQTEPASCTSISWKARSACEWLPQSVPGTISIRPPSGKPSPAIGVAASRSESVLLQPKTLHTITSADLLERELDAVRVRGYSIDDEENQTGARCIGAPVFDYSGECVGAISVSGPTIRMTDDRLLQIAPEVQRTAAMISDRLGVRP